MSGGASPNPYGADYSDIAGQYSNAPDYGYPSSDYAVPGVNNDAPYNDEFGWGPKPRISVESTPDAMRLDVVQTRTMRPQPDENPVTFYGPIDAEEASRHGVEDQHSTGDQILKSRYVMGPDPRWNPPAETRITEQLSPRSYDFTRPFDQQQKGSGERQFNGVHMSMADHRRDFEIGGIRPWGMHRNTYRTEPTPWDSDMYDVAPDSRTTPGRIQAVNVPQAGNPSFRLG